MALVLSAGDGLAQASTEKPLSVGGRIEADGSAVHLNLANAKPPRVGNVSVKRRVLGAIGPDSWREIAPQLGPVQRFTDDTTKPGIAYEYQVTRTARDIVDLGYWATGVDIPAVETRGKAIVVVDETMAGGLKPRLDRFARDLVGDGWQVIRHTTPRGDRGNYVESLTKATALREWLQDQYHADPFARYALILVGHVPIALSGRSAPDGHEAVPHASDLYYADMDGTWRLRLNEKGVGLLGENRVPSDRIEMQVGRIDFSGFKDEVARLRAYFDKNHHWRHALHGDLREAYAQSGHLIVERNGLRNIVGPDAVTKGGHHDAGEEKPWLWGSDFGDWNGGRYAADYQNKAAFVINFGSGKQKIEGFGNALSASLAQPWYTVAAGWGGRPSWWLHHMALGGTIGESHMRTVNNGIASKPYRETMDYFPTGSYLWRNPVWLNLLGDPTLRAFMMAPASEARARSVDTGVALTWNASPDVDVLGYKLYRADGPDAKFSPLNNGVLIEGTEFIDTATAPNANYMIRAYGLKQVHAGSFFTTSQAVFARVGAPVVQAQDRRFETAMNTAVSLAIPAKGTETGKVFALIEGPTTGNVALTEGDWVYTPATDFTGDVTLRYSVSNLSGTDTGLLRIKVGG